MNDPNWHGGLCEEDDLGAFRGIICGIALGALVWVVGLLIWWWL